MGGLESTLHEVGQKGQSLTQEAQEAQEGIDGILDSYRTRLRLKLALIVMDTRKSGHAADVKAETPAPPNQDAGWQGTVDEIYGSH